MPLDHFSLIAPIYARAHYRALDRMREAAALPTRGRLLDVGGGTGRVSSVLGELVDEVVVTDISMGMLRETDRTSLKPACCSSESLPFPDDSFERVIMVDAFHHVLDQAVTASEMLRVLKPGGRLVIEEPDIRTFGVKLIAVAEKLLFMRSHFFTPTGVADLFPHAKTEIKSVDGTAWVIVEKTY